MSEEVTVLVNIGGQEFDTSEVTLPANREFREAWVVGEGNVIEIDPTLKAQIRARNLAEECSTRINANAPATSRERVNAAVTRVLSRNFGQSLSAGDQAKIDMADDIFQWVLDMEAACKTAAESGNDPVWPSFDAAWTTFMKDPTA